MLKAKAHQKLSTWNPGTIQAAIRTIKAFIKKRKMPNVKTVIGSVKKIKSGLTMRFKIDKTKEIIIAAGTPLTFIPESIQSVMMTATNGWSCITPETAPLIWTAGNSPMASRLHCPPAPGFQQAAG